MSETQPAPAHDPVVPTPAPVPAPPPPVQPDPEPLETTPEKEPEPPEQDGPAKEDAADEAKASEPMPWGDHPNPLLWMHEWVSSELSKIKRRI